MQKKQILLTAFCLFSLCVLAACSGPRTGRVSGDGSVSYDDPQAVETLTTDWGSTDLQNTAEAMAQSLLQSQWISGVQSPPVIRLRDVQNLTSEHIDTAAITEKIRGQLIRSGKVTFLASADSQGVAAERDFDKNQTLRGQNRPLLHTNYIIEGKVRSIQKKAGRITDVYYLITLQLIHPESGVIRWEDEKEIRKVATKPLFGW